MEKMQSHAKPRQMTETPGYRGKTNIFLISAKNCMKNRVVCRNSLCWKGSL